MNRRKNNIKWVIKNAFNHKKNKLLSINGFEKWFNRQGQERIYNSILTKTEFLNFKHCSFAERFYCYMNDIHSVTLCTQCNNKVKFCSHKKGYGKYCSSACSNKDIRVRKKISESVTKTFYKKYGKSSPLLCKEIKNKAKKTCMKNFGVENPFESKKIQDKIKQTCLKKYGFENPNQSKIVREKFKQTCLKRYGVENPNQSEIVREKFKQTCLKKYGVINFSQLKISKESLEKLDDKEWLCNQYTILKKTTIEIACNLNVSDTTVLRRLYKFNIPINYHFFKSSFEKMIIEYINIENIITNNRSIISPYELDIYIPKHKIAIEFNGIFWHSSYKKELDKEKKKYHLIKTRLCQEKKIQLFHVFENEWINLTKQDIWKSILNKKIRGNKQIHTKRCEVKEISNNKQIKRFLEQNHLQGFARSNIKIGLFYEHELISLMTFTKSKKYQYRIIRFCDKKFIDIIDGPNKLYDYFVDNYKPRNVTVYIDRRYDSNDLYKKLGFKFDHNSQPNCWYYKSGTFNLYSYINFKVHKTYDKLYIHDPELSEIENMYNNRYRRIWDCGNTVYNWKNQ